MSKFAISNIDNTLIAGDANTTDSRYPVVSYKAFRKFATREQARAYKRSRKNPQQYAIIDTVNGYVVR